jgi:drug/metabolite transporter (DMT)-like permease
MRAHHVAQLLALAALWGASFLFIRVGVAEFGVAPLMAVRVSIGAVFLIAMLIARGNLRSAAQTMRARAVPLFIMGVLNSALPFCLFAYAELTLSAGATSVLNATTPLWGGLIAFVWLKDRLTMLRTFGMAIGFGGVISIVWDQVVSSHGASGATPWVSALAAIAGTSAAFSYGVAANFTKRYLTGVDSLTLAAGSMIASSIALIPFAIAKWPAAAISVHAWGAVLSLGIACTGVAYLMYFHLLNVTGPARAMTVTFVIPVFGILWGALFLHEHVSVAMIEGCAVVLAGTALATGVVKRIPGFTASTSKA